MKNRFFSLLIAASLLFCPPLYAGDKLTLMLDWFPNIDHLPIYVAQERGLFKEKGLEVEIISPIAMEDGLRFAIREGGRTVGAGVVIKILE